MRRLTDHLDLILQFATVFAVVFGVVLVVWELQQTRSMTYTQLVHGTIDEIHQDRAAHYGENLGEVLATACYEPQKLTRSEAFILNAYFGNQIGRANRYKIQVDLGGFSSDWKRLGKPQVMRVLSFPQGKRWLSTHPLWSDRNSNTELIDFFDSLMQQDGYSCDSVIDNILVTDAALQNDA